MGDSFPPTAESSAENEAPSAGGGAATPAAAPAKMPAQTASGPAKNVDGSSGGGTGVAAELVAPATPLSVADPELYALIAAEKRRQRDGLELIASENFTSQAVLDCLGSCLTNKYSEGLPGARYYGGSEHIDAIERLCQARALAAFGLSAAHWHVNVQPYSGSPANFAVYTGLLAPHDRIMGLALSSGGHLTHGFYTPKKRVSATSLFFESLPYAVREDSGLIDFDALEKNAKLFRPRLIICGASAYPREIDFAKFRAIADAVGALLMADISHIAGLVAAGIHASPFPHAHVVTTTTHKTLRGPRSALIFVSKKGGAGGGGGGAGSGDGGSRHAAAAAGAADKAARVAGGANPAVAKQCGTAASAAPAAGDAAAGAAGAAAGSAAVFNFDAAGSQDCGSARGGSAGGGGGGAPAAARGSSARPEKLSELIEKVDSAVFPGLQGGPHNHQIAAAATQLREVATPAFAAYARQVVRNAAALAAALTARGQRLVTGGTDNHLILWDLKSSGVSGGKFEKIADFANVSVNKNTVPGDTSALTPSGVRIGTAALTSRGCTEREMEIVADFLVRCLDIAVSIKSQCKSTKLVDFEACLPSQPDLATVKAEITQFARTLPFPTEGDL